LTIPNEAFQPVEVVRFTCFESLGVVQDKSFVTWRDDLLVNVGYASFIVCNILESMSQSVASSGEKAAGRNCELDVERFVD
jgi:hypothetical protein